MSEPHAFSQEALRDLRSLVEGVGGYSFGKMSWKRGEEGCVILERIRALVEGTQSWFRDVSPETIHDYGWAVFLRSEELDPEEFRALPYRAALAACVNDLREAIEAYRHADWRAFDAILGAVWLDFLNVGLLMNPPEFGGMPASSFCASGRREYIGTPTPKRPTSIGWFAEVERLTDGHLVWIASRRDTVPAEDDFGRSTLIRSSMVTVPLWLGDRLNSEKKIIPIGSVSDGMHQDLTSMRAILHVVASVLANDVIRSDQRMREQCPCARPARQALAFRNSLVPGFSRFGSSLVEAVRRRGYALPADPGSDAAVPDPTAVPSVVASAVVDRPDLLEEMAPSSPLLMQVWNLLRDLVRDYLSPLPDRHSVLPPRSVY